MHQLDGHARPPSLGPLSAASIMRRVAQLGEDGHGLGIEVAFDGCVKDDRRTRCELIVAAPQDEGDGHPGQRREGHRCVTHVE